MLLLAVDVCMRACLRQLHQLLRLVPLQADARDSVRRRGVQAQTAAASRFSMNRVAPQSRLPHPLQKLPSAALRALLSSHRQRAPLEDAPVDPRHSPLLRGRTAIQIE
eukprot:11169671-Lingulodinium_polyedra.AAC.1